MEYITGDTETEVEASIALAIQKTAEIVAEVEEVQQQAPQPRDELGRFMTVPGIPEPEIDFTRLSYSEFVRNRDQLIGRSIDKGLFN